MAGTVGKQPKLSPLQSKELRRQFDTGDYSISDLLDVFMVSRPTIYRTLTRQPAAVAPLPKGKPVANG